MKILKRINDTKKIEQWLAEGNILNYFDTPDLTFYAYSYEKGEYITSQNKRMDEMLFLIEGAVRVYGIRDDGSISPVNLLKSPTIIGDIEFSEQGVSPFFAEAATSVICLALSVKKYREQLDHDYRFLHMLLRFYADKLQLFSMVDSVVATIEERLLLYMRNECPFYELQGIEAATMQLRCSRRQLQRILKKLCMEKKIEKTGKGRYRLISLE